MASLWKRATPSQYRMLRAIAGAVANAAHAHRCQMPNNFARSVAKRAVGTLTAQWPDVLAAKRHRRQEALERQIGISQRRRSQDLTDQAKGDRPTFKRRSPIRRAWKALTMGMWKIKREGTPEQYAAHVRALKLLDQAQKEIDALEQH